MLGLFSHGLIEGYYDVEELVAVSEDRSKLETYIKKQMVDFHFYKRLYNAYHTIRNTKPHFNEQRPEKKKLPFTPKTREEHRIAERNSQEWRAELQIWDELYREYSKQQDNFAFQEMCQKEGVDPAQIERDRVMGRFSDYFHEPRYEIKEVEVW